MRPRLALGLFVGLAILHTWPIARAPWRESLNRNADAELTAWTLSWIAHTLPVHPTRVFDGNIFAREPKTLTYSDPMMVPALIGMPIRWLGGSPVLTFNLVLFAGLLLTAWSGWLVAARWTNSATAALVAGALAAFNVHLLIRLPHVGAAHMWGLILAVDLVDRLIEAPRRREFVWLVLVLTSVAVTSAYTTALAGVVIGVAVAMALALRRWRSAVAIAGALAVAVALAMPVLWPYLQFAASGATRSLKSVTEFSATPAGYLSATSHVHRGWSAVFHRDDVNALFAGFTGLVLAILGGWASAGQSLARRRTALILSIGLLGVLLSFGPATAAYRWLYDWVPPLQGLRAAARFGFLFLLAVAFLAAMGVAWLERHVRSRRARTALVAAVLAAVTVEAWQGPINTIAFHGVPQIYRLVADAPGRVLLVEVPFPPARRVAENGEYVLNATGHWRPVMNGYSGFMPRWYELRAPTFSQFPEEAAIAAMAAAGVTHVMVHLERYGAEAGDVQQRLAGQATLQQIAGDARGHRLYKVRR